MNVKTGIFWVVYRKLVCDFRETEYSTVTGFVNYPYSHFEMWDTLKPPGVRGDFASHPRGRLLFDIDHNIYKLFVDKSISPVMVEQIIKIIAPEKELKVFYDEHYSCS